MEVRLGQLLVQAGLLDDQQVREALEVQQETGEPLGLLCERLFGVAPSAIERAWERQYSRLTRTVDPREQDIAPEIRDLVTRRQAWQFRVVPIRRDGSELMVATTARYLRRALGFVTNVIGIPTYLVMATDEALGETLCAQYPMPGMTPASVTDDAMDRLLAIMAA